MIDDLYKQRTIFLLAERALKKAEICINSGSEVLTQIKTIFETCKTCGFCTPNLSCLSV
jgi:hypothetical protein